MSEHTELFQEAVAAFRAAAQLAEENPRPGSDEWQRWEQLVAEAIQANEAYVRRLHGLRLVPAAQAH